MLHVDEPLYKFYFDIWREEANLVYFISDNALLLALLGTWFISCFMRHVYVC